MATRSEQTESKQPHYVPCTESDVPAGVRFDVPARLDGQTVEIAYGGFGRAAHDHGDDFRRITDRTDGSVKYSRWVP